MSVQLPGKIAVQVKTAATLTDLSEATIRDAINKGELPAYRVGRAIRILAADLEDWLRSQTRVGSEEDQ
ncbi:hypothetical protein GCM10027425_33850 [Alteromonas gracilis]